MNDNIPSPRRITRYQPGHVPKQCRFARAIGTYQRHHFTGRNTQINFLQGFTPVAKGFTEGMDLNRCVHNDFR